MDREVVYRGEIRGTVTEDEDELKRKYPGLWEKYFAEYD
jgi:hypothetical protein